ncbi:MAG: hypothetical protein RR053_06405 [Evtepia sp.]
MEEKFVTYRNLKVGQKIKGVKDGGRHSMFTAFVKSINTVYVTVEMFNLGGNEKKIDSSAMFCIELTDDEFNDKYREKAKEALCGIQNKLHYDEIGYHEIWNAWLCGTPYEIAKYCVEKDMKVVGYSSDIAPKIAMFSGDVLDVGVCAECADGERFWCHFRKSDIDKMIERYHDLIA